MEESASLKGGFRGMCVLALESRRAREMAQLIANHDGEAMVAPATRDVSVEDSADVPKFVSQLLKGQFAAVIFLTGVGTRALAVAAEKLCSRQEFVAALSRTAVIARGPKPVAALRELGVAIAAVVPEPNTWRELLRLLDERSDSIVLKGRTVAVQEYGVPSPELVAGLAERGAEVVPVHTYEWLLPEDTTPLRKAVQALISSQVDVVLVTAAVQVQHLFQIADEMGLRDDLVRAFSGVVVCSIGPVTSAELRRQGISIDLEPTHPKMGFLVKEAAGSCSVLLESKRVRRSADNRRNQNLNPDDFTVR